MSRCVIFLSLFVCVSQYVYAFEVELQFVKGLTDVGFPRLAEKVLFRTLETFPEASSAAPNLRIRILIAEKRFSDAALEIDKQKPDVASALWLFLAKTATSARQLPVAESAYEAYFKGASAPDGEAAFLYGSLLEDRGDNAAAIKIYECVDSRPTKSRLSALLIESDPDRALELAEEVQLGGLDLWFGAAVVSWAQIHINRNDWVEARSVLEKELELLRSLRGSVDPIAGARYLLGTCYEHAGENVAALHQFYNVYAQYGGSEWGLKAQIKAEALIADFEGQGKVVEIDLGANLEKLEEGRFRMARRLFFDRQYADAITEYLDALNDFPEGSKAITALRELTLCAIHLDDEFCAKAVTHYLSERFASGDALLAAGKAALDQKKESLAWWIYELYLEKFPSHPRAPAVLYSLAGLRDQEVYLFQLLENYPSSTYHARALGRLAWNAFEAKEYEAAASRFAPYIDTETDPQKQTRARFAFAESCRFSKHWNDALENFQTLEHAVGTVAESFGTPKETLDFNRPFHEKSVFYQAICQKELGKLDEAVRLCARFIEQFPTSGILEQVRFTQAKTLIESARFAEALRTLKTLGAQFAEPACYYSGLAQYETGAYEESIQTLETFFTNWPASALSYEAMFVQGRAYVAAEKCDEAVRVFGDILNVASDDLLIHRASLELGRAQTDPAEKLASFQRIALLADPENADHAPLIADALFESLPLHLEMNRHADLIADADRLLESFPNPGKTKQINTLKTKAIHQQEETANERK